MKQLCLWVCLTLACSEGFAADKTLRVAIDAAWSPPQIVQTAGKPSGGLFVELFQELGHQLDAKLEWKVLPRKRLVGAIENNEADLLCHLNPKWIEQPISPERWSGPFIEQENVIIQSANRPAQILNLEQPTFFSLGTVLGFQYPKLSEQFKRGLIRRVDSPSQAVLLKNTQNGKLAYSIANRLNVDYFNRHAAPNEQLRIVQTVDIQETYCLIAPRPQIPAQQIKAALAQLHQSKQLSTIMSRYKNK